MPQVKANVYSIMSYLAQCTLVCFFSTPISSNVCAAATSAVRSPPENSRDHADYVYGATRQWIAGAVRLDIHGQSD